MDISEISNSIKGELSKVNEIIFNSIDSDEPLVNEIVEYIVKAGGKRIRPMLAIISANILGHKTQASFEVAAAIEFIHIGTLMHDDVVDNSDVRRFLPTAHTIWGNSLSILSGDFLFSRAFRLILKSRSFGVLDVLSSAFQAIVVGEVSQLARLRGRKMISLDEYYSIIEAKTSALFGASCESIAILANADEDTILLFSKIGKTLGVMFQLSDDILDYFPDKLRGKNGFDDLMEGKITIPIILLYEVVEEKDREKISESFLTELCDKKNEVDYILGLLIKYDIRGKIKKLLRDLNSQIIERVKVFDESDYKNYLIYISEYILNRVD